MKEDKEKELEQLRAILQNLNHNLSLFTDAHKNIKDCIHNLELRLQRCETLNRIAAFCASTAIGGLILEFITR